MKAFDPHLITITVFDASGCIESRSRPWDTLWGSKEAIAMHRLIS